MVVEAVMEMMQGDIKHLAVSDSTGQIVGVLSHRELISAQGQSPLFLLRDMPCFMREVLFYHMARKATCSIVLANYVNCRARTCHANWAQAIDRGAQDRNCWGNKRAPGKQTGARNADNRGRTPCLKHCH